MWGQVKANMSIIVHSVVELAVTGLTQVEGPPAVQLLAIGMVAYLWVKGAVRMCSRQTTAVVIYHLLHEVPSAPLSQVIWTAFPEFPLPVSKE